MPIRYGFWLTFGLLTFIGLVNVYFAAPGRKVPADQSEEATSEDSEITLPGSA